MSDYLWMATSLEEHQPWIQNHLSIGQLNPSNKNLFSMETAAVTTHMV